MTQHAGTVVAERNISVEWMERPLKRPALTDRLYGVTPQEIKLVEEGRSA